MHVRRYYSLQPSGQLQAVARHRVDLTHFRCGDASVNNALRFQAELCQAMASQLAGELLHLGAANHDLSSVSGARAQKAHQTMPLLALESKLYNKHDTVQIPALGISSEKKAMRAQVGRAREDQCCTTRVTVERLPAWDFEAWADGFIFLHIEGHYNIPNQAWITSWGRELKKCFCFFERPFFALYKLEGPDQKANDF